MSFITDRPKNEPGFMVVRQERDGRMMAYTTRAYVADKPEGERYAS
jgi:ribulose-bisphosphate carboxylase small chain